MTVKFALPTGDHRAHVGEVLAAAGIATAGYEPSSRVLRNVLADEGLTLRVFREKDIPVQVALGNYHLGICSDLWLAELQVRYPLQHVVRVGTFPGPWGEVWLCAAPDAGLGEGEVPSGRGLAGARIVSELPNLADLVCAHLRAPGYRSIPLYGSAEAYPPEDAELVLMPAASAEAVAARNLVPLQRVFAGGLALIANAGELGDRDLSALLGRLAPLLQAEQPVLRAPRPTTTRPLVRQERDPAVLRLAVPDGHAQRHAPATLREAGIEIDGYDERAFVRRPRSTVEGLSVKVVRPQDMPQLIAMGAFDAGISGRDILHEHRCRFPGSPVEMAVDLRRNRYRIGPVVEAGFPVDTTAAALPRWRALGRPVRIASELPGTAEQFARDNHLTSSSIIPVAGASEGFVPEDADILIEGTETGSSLRANGLKMLDAFMEATSCLVVRTVPVTSRAGLLDDLVSRLARSAEAVEAG